MNKKMMLLALSVVSAALFALPAVAAANPAAHISATENFTVSGTKTVLLETHSGEKVECHPTAQVPAVTGTGSFENTTTGSVKLTFHGCTTTTIFGSIHCQSAGQPTGTITSTVLPFHLIGTLGPENAGVLITPTANSNEHFATFTCAGIQKIVSGNGVLGTITSPKCGAAATKTATLSFEQDPAKTGFQKHTNLTGVTYSLKSNGTQAAQIAEANLNFVNTKSITCT